MKTMCFLYEPEYFYIPSSYGYNLKTKQDSNEKF